MKQYLLAAVVLLLAGCGDSITGPAHVACDDFLLQLGATSGDTIQTSEGLRYIDVRSGTGEAATAGMLADVNYSGYLLNGTQFDTSCPTNRAVLRVAVRGGGVIPGFAFGLDGMRTGGVRRVIIPPNLGYGNTPTGPIPANSTLIFDLLLVGIVGR